jgi:hypothetical protein
MKAKMRAQFYSLIAVMIIVPIVFFFMQYMLTTQSVKSGVSDRIVSDQVHQVEKTLETDFVKALETIGKRSLIAANDRVITNGTPLDNSALGLNELMINGTLNGTENLLMRNNTLTDWMQNVLNVQTNFNVSMNYSNLSIRNYDGFNVLVSANLNITVTDYYGIAKIEKADMRKEALVSILDFEDPMFSLNTQGLVRTIKKYPLGYYAVNLGNGTSSSGNCSGTATFDNSTADPSKILVTNNALGLSGWKGIVSETTDLPSDSCYVVGAQNITQIVNLTINQTGYDKIYIDNRTSSPNAVWHLPVNLAVESGYYKSSNGPNFLQRLENNKNGSDYGLGLESFINLFDLQWAGLPVDPSKNSVDYLYFSNQSYNVKRVRGIEMPNYEWFKLNSTNAAEYNLTALLEP